MAQHEVVLRPICPRYLRDYNIRDIPIRCVPLRWLCKQHSPDLPDPTVHEPERLRVLRLRRCWVAHSPIGLNGRTNYAGKGGGCQCIIRQEIWKSM